MLARASVLATVLGLSFGHVQAVSATEAALVVEAKIPLGRIAGRIDHLAFDPMRERLYVAELGNNTIGIIDTKSRTLLRTVSGFEEPQGIAYEPTTDTVYVANGGDGSVRLFRGGDFAAVGQIPLGEDADNVRVDAAAHRVYVGYGSGALAVIDPTTRRKIADIALKAHPESFQLEPAGDRVFVNVPDAGQIAVVSRKDQRQIASWPTSTLRANFPLTLDVEKSRLIAIFRQPARLQTYEMSAGKALSGTDVGTDADDVFIDARRKRAYVICGEGVVDVLDLSGDALARIARISTVARARTGLFIKELDRLVVAIRGSDSESAAIWLLRPDP